MQQVASSGVKINILDSNDNSPIFNETSYSFTIPEDLQPGSLIANVSATDKDSGEFGKITYSLRGFGMDKFGTNLKHGNLYLLGSKLYYVEIFMVKKIKITVHCFLYAVM